MASVAGYRGGIVDRERIGGRGGHANVRAGGGTGNM